MKLIVMAGLMSVATLTHATETNTYKQYVYIANDSPNTVTAMTAVATDGTETVFHRDVPLKGGNRGTMVQFASHTKGRDGCFYNVTFTFNRGENLVIENYDACKYRSIHVGRQLRAGRLAGNRI